jgi:hypothetical protein
MSILSPIFIDIYSEEPTIEQYFTSLNDRDFRATAALFTELGCLQPPFDRPIQGREQIAEYLEKEAVGMIFMPERTEVLISDKLGDRYQIYGKVATKYFSLNLNWLMQLNPAKQLASVEIKLLASLPELLKIEQDRVG